MHPVAVFDLITFLASNANQAEPSTGFKLVAVFDIITFVASMVALIILLRGWKRALELKAKLVFTGLLVFTLSYGLFLFIEWAGITEALDRAEDIIGALVPMWWAFVIYAFLAGTIEQKLREREARLHVLFDEAPIGYHELDTQGRITRVNRTELDMLGYTAEEMLGKPVWEFSAEKEKSRDTVTDKLAGDIPPGRVFERTLRRKDGSKLAVLVGIRLLRDESGHIRGIRSTIQNIAKRKLAEESLAEERNLLRILIDNMPDNIYVKDKESRFIVANIAVARFMGAEAPEELLGATDFDFYPKELAAKYYADGQKVIESGKPLVSREEPAIDANGNRRWSSTTKVPLRDSHGKIVGLVGISRDITARKLAEHDREKLMQTLALKNKELESILYVTSHDLRSPLVNIQGFSSELSRCCDLIHSALKDKIKAADMSEEVHTAFNKDVPEALGFILRSAKKMDSLLSGLLRLSRLGQAGIDIKRLDMNALLTDVTKNMEYQVKEAGATVDLETLPACLGDSSQINQIFSNILDNALKYLDKSRPGMILIYGKIENDQSIYCVEDNGVGIAPEHQNKIFEVFHRLEPDEKSGEGLGLTIVRRILDGHNGKIWVESELGKGSKFFVSLPSD
ncbi:MAG: sensor histidine kinase [Planctomycetota bacterium]|jgi:PAS domain S-box-containing protein